MNSVDSTSGSLDQPLTPSGRAWEVCLLRSGLTPHGYFFRDSVVQESVRHFDNVKVFVKTEADGERGGLPGRDVRNIVGWIDHPRFVEAATPDRAEVHARMCLVDNAPVVGLMVESWNRGARNLVALDPALVVEAQASLIEGRRVRDVTRIRKVRSVDLCDESSYGVGVVRLAEACAVHGIDALPHAPQDSPIAARMRAAETRLEATLAIEGMLARSNLPPAARSQLATRFRARPPGSVEDIALAIAAEKRYLRVLLSS